MKTFAFIFARGGSKGLPGKNIKILGDHPLLAHSILIAKETGVDEVYVSTEDEQIALVAKNYGAQVIPRPAELATDTASEWLAWKHAIQYLRGKGIYFDIFLSLPTTAPLRNLDDVKRCLAFLDKDTDIVVTVSPSARSPYFNMVTRDVAGYSQVVIGDNNFKRRQDAPQVYDMTTVAYVTHPDFVMNNTSMFQGKVRSVVIPKERAIDIDDDFDFLVAEALFKKCQQSI